jgi:hypothetical protein
MTIVSFLSVLVPFGSVYSNILDNIVAIGIGISFHSLCSAKSSLLGIRRKLRRSQLCAFFFARIAL